MLTPYNNDLLTKILQTSEIFQIGDPQTHPTYKEPGRAKREARQMGENEERMSFKTPSSHPAE